MGATDKTVADIEIEAAQWLLRKESPKWSLEDEKELNAWLNASTSHRVSFIRLKSAWQQTPRLKRSDTLSSQFPQQKHSPRSKRGIANSTSIHRRHPGPAAALGVLAAMALVISSAMLWQLGIDRAPRFHTPVGGLSIIPLEDGSVVSLNTDSAISLKMTSGERRINLLRGEAFFDVSKDPARDFVVYAGTRKVIAVGTRFGVRINHDSVQVAVTEGLVRIAPETRLIDRVPGLRKDHATDSNHFLNPGEVATADGNLVKVDRHTIGNVEQMLGWRSGNVLLQRVLLKDAIAEFNRYNRRKLVLAQQDLGNIRVGGNFKTENIDGFVRLLEQGFQIHASEHNDVIVLSR